MTRDRDDMIRAAIKDWRDSLINLSGTNRLLNFKPRPTSTVTITRPQPQDILDGLGTGTTFFFRSLAPEEDDTDAEANSGQTQDTPALPPVALDRLDTPARRRDLHAALTTLMRRSNADFMERGLWVLYLAFGTLTWTDEDATRYTSPLLLVPVRLVPTGPRQPPYLVPSEEEHAVNPALTLKLAQNSIALPATPDLDEVSLETFLSSCQKAVAGQPGWAVEPTVQLSYFSFAKEAMYRDLLDNEEVIAAHLGIQALATGGRGEDNSTFTFDDMPEERIDIDASPETAALALDADSSQRACIAAAVAGRSFVMDGPPGTGKSQTISNMIGALLNAGKTVLFVSEKAAALEVVRNRLEAVGLGSYLLELHSHKATRKEVALALGQALDTVAVAPSPMSALDRAKAQHRREQLNAYADAMNRIRQPLGLSLHAVLGMIASHPDAPVAPLTGLHPADLSIDMFGHVRQLAADLARSWRPASQGSSFIWRGVTDRTSFQARLFQAGSALERLQALSEATRAPAQAFGLTRPSQAAQLAKLLITAQSRPEKVPDNWLTMPDLSAVHDRVERLRLDLERISNASTKAESAAHLPWQDIPDKQTCPQPDLAPLGALHPLGLVPTADTDAQQIRALISTLSHDADMLTAAADALAGVASILGLPTPSTFAEAHNVLAIAAVAAHDQRPLARWLTEDGLDRALVCAQVCQHAVTTLAQTEAAAARLYRPDALSADVRGLELRFRTEHHGLKKLLGDYRADKRAVQAITRDGVDPEQAQSQLALLTAWQDARDQLAQVSTTHSDGLGPFYRGVDTDFPTLHDRLQDAQALLARSPLLDLQLAASTISHEAAPHPEFNASTHRLREELLQWQSRLALPPQLAARPQLFDGSIASAASWLRAHLDPLTAAATFVETISTAVGRPLTFHECQVLARLRSDVDDARASLRTNSELDADVLEGLYAGVDTDMDQVAVGAAWATGIRALSTGQDASLTLIQLKLLAVEVPAQQLHDAAQAWEAARTALLTAFDSSRQAELAVELDNIAEAQDLLVAWQQDPGGQEEWFAHHQARQQLDKYGLSTAILFCIQERVTPEHLAIVIELALLREWVDHLLQEDPALQMIRAEDRDALIAEYRQLDTLLVTTATADIILSCNLRRPRNDLGQAAVIRREAEKKKKHMPVRTLIDRSRGVAQAIKPCFMMSPLAVSQYLPPDMHFDVVIFDEASQVPPGEAINCIYRGEALITAGDQKQLPPTSFFAASADDGDEWSEDDETSKDFDSILDLTKASGAYKSMTLRWHYRSRHEALIAFSNHSFYCGKLVTFPGAEDHGPDVGLELFPVDGVYRRGSTRDNPLEAAAVAQRVAHHYDTRPGRSLGVVTFSEAQAVTVMDAVDKLRLERPDLERHFKEDRLNGFFIKNLESVQGDERDVMIFSIGYGPDENKKITMNFGPLNRPGGWRRLNVAITRARYRNEIVSSVTASDISATTTSDGVRHLRRYLDMAARGLVALALDPNDTGETESPFEDSVLEVIRNWGYDVVSQVGAAGYRIDLGIRHPEHSAVYVLGVECDGLQYHSSKVARDRDRLREQVLTGLGWHLHRIWGTAWYRNQTGEQERLRAAIEHAISLPVRGLLSEHAPAGLADRPPVRTEAATFERQPEWTVPYQKAVVASLARWTDPGEAGSQFEMTAGIRSIVATEAPVHLTVVHQRLREAWNIGRVGARIRDNIDAAIRLAEVVRDGDFILATRPVVHVRTPTDQVARNVEQVHDDELRLALAGLVADTGGITSEELTQAAARLFGWTRRGPDITSRLDRLVRDLIEQGRLRREGEALALNH